MFRFTIAKALLVGTVLTAGGLAVGPVSRAGATIFPAHAPGAVSCNSGAATITAFAPAGPSVVTGTIAPGFMKSFYLSPARERVEWSSSVEVYNGSRWVLYDNRSDPWHFAFANNYGLQSWYYVGVGSFVWTNGPNSVISSDRYIYDRVAPGYYRVWNYFYWDSINEVDPVLATNYNGAVPASYCYMR
jgi:hypothetical protein